MKRTLAVLSALIALACIASASPLCTSNTIAFYEATYVDASTACAVGDKLFYGFTYTGSTTGGAVAPSGAQIFVNTDVSNPLEPGLVFTSAGWSVSGTSGSTTSTTLAIDASIGFVVQTVSGAPLILDTALDFAGHFTATAGGQSFVGETVVFPDTTSVFLEVDSNAGPFTQTAQFAGVSSVQVSKDLQVRIAKNSTGTASISQFTEGFSESPEPVSGLLIGSGLLGIAFWRRRS